MKVQLRSIISEIEAAQRKAELSGRSVEIVWLTSHDEVAEFKAEFAKLLPDSEDKGSLFTGDTFWKGSKIKIFHGNDHNV